MLGALAVQVAAVATSVPIPELADLASNIQLARLSLPSGSYSVKVELLGADQQVVASHDYPD